jgi:AraC family transcriptional regulator of adaptative response / DNA-3-methyladenine glycosylase II
VLLKRFPFMAAYLLYPSVTRRVRFPLAATSVPGEDGGMLVQDPDTCYRAVRSRDPRFDGVFYTAVRTTGIYCRPSCPATTPRRDNVVFYRTAAAAQQAGFRACKRCRPDATPGSPEWDSAADVAGRAMRLIADGVVEREGVPGLAAHVGYTPRHLTRLLSRELGAGPLALARAQRAHTARILIDSTTMPLGEVAFAAGFASIRQFNDTVRAVYASTPGELRRRAVPRAGAAGDLVLRLAVRAPFAARPMLAFLARRAVPEVEWTEVAPGGYGTYSRTLRLPHGPGRVSLRLDRQAEAGVVSCALRLTDLRDLPAAVERCRRLLDADCDPTTVDGQLGGDRLLRGMVRLRPGLRVPGHVDGEELAVRALLGQQVSIAGARTLTAEVVRRYGEPAGELGGRLFPSVSELFAVPVTDLPMPRARARALLDLCAALREGDVVLDRGAPRAGVQRALLAVPGIGPWTAGYIALRALADPDVWMPADLHVRRGLDALGIERADHGTVADRWRPWRSYAQMHLWLGLPTRAPGQPAPRHSERRRS